MAVNYGQVAIVPKGEWNVETQYKVNNLVSYDGSSYVAKVQPPVGTLPTDTSYWQVSAVGTKKATADSLGTVMPDGTTTSVGEDGKLSVNTAQQDALGVVKGSDDITVGEDGTLTVNTTFKQATELANIIAGEAIKSVLGKVSKAIATTMNLDENALLKNMISGIDVNDGNKVPSSAYIHSLVERIGMGTALEGGFDNLTAGLNSVNNNLSNAGIPTVKKITDLYAIKKSGFYCYDAGASNAPMSSRGGMVIANYLSDAWISLNVVPYALSKIYTNSKYNSTWTGWSELASKNDLTTVSELLSQPPSEYCTFSQWAAIAERSGNEVTLSFNVGGKIKEISTIFLLKTLPEKYRPKSNKHISYRTQEGYDMAIFIMTDGQIQLFTGGKAVSGYFLRQVITYPAA